MNVKLKQKLYDMECDNAIKRLMKIIELAGDEDINLYAVHEITINDKPLNIELEASFNNKFSIHYCQYTHTLCAFENSKNEDLRMKMVGITIVKGGDVRVTLTKDNKNKQLKMVDQDGNTAVVPFYYLSDVHVGEREFPLNQNMFAQYFNIYEPVALEHPFKDELLYPVLDEGKSDES